MDPAIRRELDELLSVLLDGEPTPRQAERLGKLLTQSAEARDRYLAFFEIQAELALGSGMPALASPVTRDAPQDPASVADRPAHRVACPPRAAAKVNVVPHQPWLVVAAVGMLGLAAGILVARLVSASKAPQPIASREVEAEPTHTNVAVLLQSPGAEWGEKSPGLQPGVPLAPGWLHLKSGLAYIQFYSGATVILEGPADFQLISSQQAYCSRGKLRANVPEQAQGFTVGSPQLDLVDLGTEFGLLVERGERTEVHVFQGKVELFDPGSNHSGAARAELTAGRGLLVDQRGADNNIPSDSTAFLAVEDLEARLETRVFRHHQEWLKASESLRSDPGLITYYDFQHDPPHGWTLENQSLAANRTLDGTIVGCSWGQGRWPGKLGLEFRRISDRVRVRVPGEFDALTLMASVRVDSFPSRYAPLLMTDGWDERAPHWHIRQDGKLSLGVQGFQVAPPAFYSTDIIFTPERLGQWAYLAVVYDRPARQVSHYLDGNCVLTMPLSLDVPLRIGDAEIGNWIAGSQADTKYPIRFLSGCIDEFLIYDRALTGDEINAHYLRGGPPP